jgi:GNAT superfamily N-acetyltransferase
MVYSGPDVEPAEHEVQAVSFEVVRPAIIRDWRVMNPAASDEELGQLADRTVLYGRGAELIRLVVFEGDEIAAHADLYVDTSQHLAQFENLVTHVDFRGRGYGDALVRYSLRRAEQSGCDLCCLTAGLNEWPYEWYRRFGYVDAGRTHHFSRRSRRRQPWRSVLRARSPE